MQSNDQQRIGTAPVATPDPPNGAGSTIGRRALLVAASVGACAAATGLVVKGEGLAQQEVAQLLSSEVGTLEGVALDDALRVAELTRQAVQAIVLPVARMVSLIGEGALALLIGLVTKARQALGAVGINVDALLYLQQMLASWQTSVAGLPIALTAFTTADIRGAETYLRALKAKVNPPAQV